MRRRKVIRPWSNSLSKVLIDKTTRRNSPSKHIKTQQHMYIRIIVRQEWANTCHVLVFSLTTSLDRPGFLYVWPKGTGSWKEVRRIRCTYVIKFCPQESWSIVMQSRQYPDKTRRSQVIISCWMDVVQAPTRHIGSFKEEIDLNGKYQHPSLNSEFSCTRKGLETTKLDLAAHNLSDSFFRYINRSWNT